MKRTARVPAAASILAMAASASSATPGSGDLVLGRYLAVTETESDVELDLRKGGVAIYTFSSWEPGKSATSVSKYDVSARWELKSDVLHITFAGSRPDQTVTYGVSSCLSYKWFGGKSCSPGLQPILNGMGGAQYKQPLWLAKAFKAQ